MKLFELTEPIDVYKEFKNKLSVESIRDIENILHSIYPNLDFDYVDNGAFAHVYQSNNDPGTVFKVSATLLFDPKAKITSLERRLSKSGYLQYATKIAAHQELRDNIYLPKIYSIKFLFSPVQKALKYIIELETLEPIHDVTLSKYKRGDEHSYGRQLLFMADKMFEGFENYLDTLDEHEKDKLHLRTIGDVIAYQLRARVENHEKRSNPQLLRIKDKQLIEALNVIEHITLGDHTDIYPNNLMIRRTRYGLQLVITDPIAGT